MKDASGELTWTTVGVGLALALGGVFMGWAITSGKVNTWLDKLLSFI